MAIEAEEYSLICYGEVPFVVWFNSCLLVFLFPLTRTKLFTKEVQALKKSHEKHHFLKFRVAINSGANGIS